MFNNFRRNGKASFILGGQWGSEGKGAAAAALAVKLAERDEYFGVVTTNAGVQSGHTSVHDGVTRVAYHLPTAALVANRYYPTVFLNAGSIIDPGVLEQELADSKLDLYNFHIHPNAAVITQDCRDAENRPDSAQTKIASTRKGVGEALSRKVLRSGMVARDHKYLKQFTQRSIHLNTMLRLGVSVLVEVPQGYGLSLNGPFYPYCTSRDCTVMQAMSDAGIHPQYYGASMLVLRTYPIRVGNIVESYDKEQRTIEGHGQSGSCHLDQKEISWGTLGVKPEITTVTKRIRRVFTFSRDQMVEAMTATRPDVVFLTFCDYVPDRARLEPLVRDIHRAAANLRMATPEIVFAYGPSTADVYEDMK